MARSTDKGTARCGAWLCFFTLATVAAGCAADPPKGPPSNVIVLSIDSLRCDRLPVFNDKAVARTPHLDRLAGSGVVFTNAWATAPWTAPSIVSVFTGLYPPGHGVVHRDDTTPAHLPTMPRVLAAQGYRLGNFSFFSGISYFRNLGFPPPPRSLGHRHAVQAFHEWLQPEGPFLAWIHLVEPHLPYGVSGYRAREVTVPGSSGLEMAQLQAELPVGSAAFDSGDRERLLELYDRDVEAADTVVGEIVEVLENAGILDSTLIVVVADHGEEILDRGWVGHASTALQAKLIPEILRIPMIIAGPGIPEAVVSDGLVQQVDILPTLCRVLGLTAPPDLDGKVIEMRSGSVLTRREVAFFDSSAAGNLTPVERRSERLQGVTDGAHLLTRHSESGSTTATTTLTLNGDTLNAAGERRLSAVLAEWQVEQAGRRISILSDSGMQPPVDAVDGFAERIIVTRPDSRHRLGWQAAAGQVAIEWRSDDGEHWVQYEVGDGVTKVEGIFHADSNPMIFGPFPEGFWNDLARHNPYRFRVFSPELEARSSWVDFDLDTVQ